VSTPTKGDDIVGLAILFRLDVENCDAHLILGVVVALN
jgi:hypothetical protein